MKTKPNDNAFPEFIKGDVQESGLTKREWFAGMAMQGLVRHSNVHGVIIGINQLCIDAIKYAYALIEELNKEKK